MHSFYRRAEAAPRRRSRRPITGHPLTTDSELPTMSKSASPEIDGNWGRSNSSPAPWGNRQPRLDRRAIAITGVGVLLITGLMLLGEQLRGWPDLAVLAAWFLIWLLLSGYLYRQRRLRREHFRTTVVREESWLYKLLKSGLFTWLLASLIAAPLAAGLLINLGAGIDRAIWFLLLFLLPFWVIRNYRARTYVSRHFVPPFDWLVAERAIFWGSSLLTISLLGGLLLLVPQPDYSGVPFSEILTGGTQVISANNSFLHTLINLGSIFQSIINWTMQKLIIVAPSASAAWATSITLMILQALWITPLLLLLHSSSGVVELIWRPLTPDTASGTIMQWVLLTLLGLVALGHFLAKNVMRDWFDPVLTMQIGDTKWSIRESQLRKIPPAENWLPQERNESANALLTQVDQETDSLFASVHARVPEYLDWYYSFGGRGIRAATGVLGWLPGEHDARARMMLSEKLFPEEFSKRGLGELEQQIDNIYHTQIQSLASSYKEAVSEQLASIETEAPPLSHQRLLSPDLASILAANISDTLGSKRAIGSVAMAATAGGLSPKALQLASKKMASRATKKAGEKHAKAQTIRKIGRVGRYGTCGGVTAAATPSGPMALGVGVTCISGVTATAIWADIKIEERLERETMTTQLHAEIDEHKKTMKRSYRTVLMDRFKADAQQLENSAATWIRPSDALNQRN